MNGFGFSSNSKVELENNAAIVQIRGVEKSRSTPNSVSNAEFVENALGKPKQVHYLSRTSIATVARQAYPAPSVSLLYQSAHRFGPVGPSERGLSQSGPSLASSRPLPSSSGSRAMLVAIRRASSAVSTFCCGASVALSREQMRGGLPMRPSQPEKRCLTYTARLFWPWMVPRKD